MNTKSREDHIIVKNLLEVNQRMRIADVEVTATADEINSLDLSAVGALMKVKKLSIASAPTGSEQDTGWDLPAKSIVYDVILDVITAEVTGTTKTMNIGLKAGESGGDADGFAAAINCASTGLVRPGVTVTSGATETYVSAFTRGALLTSGTPIAGTNTVGDEGSYYEKPFLATSVTAKSVCFTASAANWAEFRGDIYIVYAEIG